MLKILCPHLYLTKPNPNVNTFTLRVLIPLAFDYDNVVEVVPTLNEDMEEFAISIKFGGRSENSSPNVFEKDFEITPNPVYWPGNPEFISVSVFETAGEIGIDVEKGVFSILFTHADDMEISDGSPCVYLTKPPATDYSTALYTLIPLDGTHSIKKLLKEELNENGEIGITITVEGGSSDNPTPLRNVQYIQIPTGTNPIIRTEVLKAGVGLGDGKVRDEDADDKGFD